MRALFFAYGIESSQCSLVVFFQVFFRIINIEIFWLVTSNENNAFDLISFSEQHFLQWDAYFLFELTRK